MDIFEEKLYRHIFFSNVYIVFFKYVHIILRHIILYNVQTYKKKIYITYSRKNYVKITLYTQACCITLSTAQIKLHKDEHY